MHLALVPRYPAEVIEEDAQELVLSLDSVYVRVTKCRWSLADQVGHESPEARDSLATPP